MEYPSQIGNTPGFDKGTEADVPTSENSKRKTDSSKLPSELNSPANIGDASC